MKNYADLRGCYPAQPSASADNSLLGLHSSSYHNQPHPIIVKYVYGKRVSLKRVILNIFRYYCEHCIIRNVIG